MSIVIMGKVYKSTPSRLLKFFEGSRDSWKEKTISAKAGLKNANKKLKYTKEKLAVRKSENIELKEKLSVFEALLENEKKHQPKVN